MDIEYLNNDNDNKTNKIKTNSEKNAEEYKPYSLIPRIDEPYPDISHDRFKKKYLIIYNSLL